MSRNRWLLLTLISGILLTAGGAWAQNNCVSVRAIGQAYVGVHLPVSNQKSWGGPVYLTLDGQEVLEGIFYGTDGAKIWGGQNDLMGRGTDGSYTFVFEDKDGNYVDGFTTDVTNAVFPNPPGNSGFGSYQAAHKIISGTGRFSHASGNIVVTGTYFIYRFAGGTQSGGRWNPEVFGKICGIDPPQI